MKKRDKLKNEKADLSTEIQEIDHMGIQVQKLSPLENVYQYV